MDGVIVDTEALHKTAYYQVFDSLGLEVSSELYNSLTGSSTINSFEKLVAHFSLNEDPAELVLQKRKYYVDMFENDPNLQLIEGVRESIEYFYNKGCTLILASSSARENIDRVFNRFNLNPFFKEKISGAELTSSKPHPEIFEKAVTLSQQPKTKCIVIEDSTNGVKAAKAAQIFTVGFKSPETDAQDLSEADIIIDDFSVLQELF